jgi:hypothetical protein
MPRFIAHALFALAATSALIAPMAQAASSKAAEQRYRADVAYCKSGKSQQDRSTCLREAGAARAEASKGNLKTPAGTDVYANATERCKAQPAADQQDCIKRITGAGNTTTEGSVRGGGVIRETVTPVKP